MTTPIPFSRLAKGNAFTFQHTIYRKTGQRTAVRCDVTLPKLRIRVKSQEAIVWLDEREGV